MCSLKKMLLCDTLFPYSVKPTDFNWVESEGTFIPAMCLNNIPENILKTCGCDMKCDSKRCFCRNIEIKCIKYCHKNKAEQQCNNR